MIGGVAVFVTSIMLLIALTKEYEKKMQPWIYVFAIFTLFRLFAFIFFSIVNDMIFAYNIMMCILWVVFSCISVYGWLLVYSLYIELSDLTKLEDLAHLRVKFQHTCHNPRFHALSPPRLKSAHFYRSLSDGYHAVVERIDDSLHSRFQTNDTAQYRLNDAGQLIICLEGVLFILFFLVSLIEHVTGREAFIKNRVVSLNDESNR